MSSTKPGLHEPGGAPTQPDPPPPYSSAPPAGPSASHPPDRHPANHDVTPAWFTARSQPFALTIASTHIRSSDLPATAPPYKLSYALDGAETATGKIELAARQGAREKRFFDGVTRYVDEARPLYTLRADAPGGVGMAGRIEGCARGCAASGAGRRGGVLGMGREVVYRVGAGRTLVGGGKGGVAGTEWVVEVEEREGEGKKGVPSVLRWKDGRGTVVARERARRWEGETERSEPRLEVLLPVDEDTLHWLVAAWCLRNLAEARHVTFHHITFGEFRDLVVASRPKRQNALSGGGLFAMGSMAGAF